MRSAVPYREWRTTRTLMSDIVAGFGIRGSKLGEVKQQQLRLATIRSAKSQCGFVADGEAVAFLHRHAVDVDRAGCDLHPHVSPRADRVVDRIARTEHRGVHACVLID